MPGFPPPVPPPPPLLPLPPPQPTALMDAANASSTTSASQFRRRFGSAMKKIKANAVPPAEGQNSILVPFAALVAPVVLTVSVDVCVPVPFTVRDAGFKLHVGMSFTPVIDVVTLQVRLTVPLNPLVPVTLTVAVLPVVALGVTVSEVVPPVPGPKGGAMTVAAMLVAAVNDPEVPVMVTVAGLEVIAAEVLAASVSTCVPAVEPAANDAVTPLGSPLAAKATVPEKPPASVTVIVAVALLPWTTDIDVGEADSVKLGTAATVTEAACVALE